MNTSVKRFIQVSMDTVVIDYGGGPANTFLIKGPVYVYIGFEQQRIPGIVFKGQDIKP